MKYAYRILFFVLSWLWPINDGVFLTRIVSDTFSCKKYTILSGNGGSKKCTFHVTLWVSRSNGLGLGLAHGVDWHFQCRRKWKEKWCVKQRKTKGCLFWCVISWERERDRVRRSLRDRERGRESWERQRETFLQCGLTPTSPPTWEECESASSVGGPSSSRSSRQNPAGDTWQNCLEQLPPVYALTPPIPSLTQPPLRREDSGQFATASGTP